MLGLLLGFTAHLNKRAGKVILAVVDVLQTIPALALLAVSGPAIGAALYADARVGDHLSLLALGVLFSCWQTLCAAILSGVGRQGAAAGIALAGAGLAVLRMDAETTSLEDVFLELTGKELRD